MGYIGNPPSNINTVQLTSNVAASVVNANVGILSNLQTTEKGNVVAAINDLIGNIAISVSTTAISTGTTTGTGTFANVFADNTNATSAHVLSGNIVLQGLGNGITLKKGMSSFAKYVDTVSSMANLNILEADTWYINTLSEDTVLNFYNVPTGSTTGAGNTVISTATVILPTQETPYRANAWVNGSPANENTFLSGTVPDTQANAINIYTFTIISVDGQSKILGSHQYYETF